MELVTRSFSGKKFLILLLIGAFFTSVFFYGTYYHPHEKLIPLKENVSFDIIPLELVTLPPQFRNDSAKESNIFVSPKFEKLNSGNDVKAQNGTGNSYSSKEESKLKEKLMAEEEELRQISIASAGYNFDVNSSEIVPEGNLIPKNKDSKPSFDIMDKYRCKCDVKSMTHERDKLLEQITRTNPLYNLSSEEVLSRHHPNVPLEMVASLKACSSMPPLHNIIWNANYWQVFASKSGVKYSLYSAFYDARLETVDAPVVHILILKNNPKEESLFCNVWFKPEEGPISIEITKIHHIDYQSKGKNRLLPFLLTCPIPGKEMRVPIAVSLTDRRCGTFTNMLKIIGKQSRNIPEAVETRPNGETQWRVGICGPALYYFHDDISKKLVDWMETLRAIGVSKVHLYETDYHPNMDKVLRYYESENFLETTMFSYPEPYINEPNLRRYWTEINRKAMFAMENIYFTDCVLRFKDNFRFLSHIDPDEMIIVEDGKSLPEFMRLLLSQNKLPDNPAAYELFSTFYPENLPPDPEVSSLPVYLYTMRHTMHFNNMPKHQSYGKVKSIYDTDYVEGVFSHRVLFCNRDPCRIKSKEVPLSLAHVAHIRSTCDDDCQKKETFVATKALIKHKEMIKNNVEKVLVTLGLQ